MAQEGWGKAGYLSALVASTTVLGGMAIQLGEVAAGRDPKDITDDKKWGVPGLRFGLASFLKLEEEAASRVVAVGAQGDALEDGRE